MSRKLHFWLSGGDVFMAAGGRGVYVPEAEHAHLRSFLRAHARAARLAGDREANRLWSAKWRDLGDAMAALEHWKLCVRGRGGVRGMLENSSRELARNTGDPRGSLPASHRAKE